MMQLGKHIAGGAGFVSNFILLKETGYFDSTADTKILLHLWSLGVEEQFYIICPILLCILAKNKNLLVLMIFTLGILSFYLNVNGVKLDIEASFYLPQTRFWELMCGSILSWLNLYKTELGFFKNTDKDQRISNFASFAGCGLLIFGFVRIDQSLFFPGFWALIPVSGALLIIAAGEGAWINRVLLSQRLAVWVGTISYPLYLWHWVLLTFPRIILAESPKKLLIFGLLALAILLAWLTYSLLERPIRSAGLTRGRTALLLGLMGLTGVLGIVTYMKGDEWLLKTRMTNADLAGDTGHLEYHRFIADTYVLCTPEAIAQQALKWEGFTRCMQSKHDQKIDIALIGDSHAEHLFLGMAEALPLKNIVFYIKGSPLFADQAEYKDIFEFVIQDKNIKTVFLTMYWSSRIKKVPKGSTLDAEMIKVIDLFLAAQKKVFILGDIPIFPSGPERCKRRYREGQAASCVITRQEVEQQREVYDQALKAVVQLRPSVSYLPIDQYLCENDRCSMYRDGSIFYRDKNHLNLKGSSFVGRQIIEQNLSSIMISNH